MVHSCHQTSGSRILVLVLLGACMLSGCGVVPRSRMDECQNVSQLLRAENARLKDRVLALQSQNRDYADRAVDDLRRLTARDRAIDRLEQDIRAYQEDRERLAAAYDQLRAGLGRRPADERTDSGVEGSLHESTRPGGDRLSSSMTPRPRSLPAREDRETSRDASSGGSDQTGP